MQFSDVRYNLLKCYETCDILGLELCEPVLNKFHFKEKKKEKKIEGLFMSHI